MKKILLSMAVVFAFANNSVEKTDINKTVDSNSMQEDFDSDFGSGMDSDFADIKVKKEKKKSYNLNFNGMIKARGYRFIQPTHYENKDNDLYHADSVIQLDSKFKKDNYIVSTSLYSMIGTDYYSYDNSSFFHEFRDNNDLTPIAGIRELYMIRSSDNYDIILGKRVFKAGISTLYSPSDVYNIKLSPDPLDPYTIGTWLADFEYYNDRRSYGFVLFPFISSSKTANEKSRWAGNPDSSSSTQSSFIVPVGTTIINDSENKIRVLAKYKANDVLYNQGIDWMLNIGYGPSLYNVLEYTDKKNVYLKTRPEVVYVSTGFSTTYKKLEVHSEVYYQNTLGGADDDFISAVVGSRYTLDKFVDKVGFNKIDMVLEYVREVVVEKYDSTVSYRSSSDERAPKNDILINMTAEINDKWSLGYFGNFRLELNQQKDSGRYQKVNTTYKVSDGLTATLFAEMFNGDVNSYYGKWKDNDRIGLDLKYSF